MKRKHMPLLWIAAGCIVLPMFVMLIWCVTDRWSWPDLIPQTFSLRGLRELASAETLGIMGSSVLLSSVVAVISVAVGFLTARAVVFGRFPGRDWVVFGAMLPLIVPAAVFGMGIHLLFVRTGLSDTVTGVVLVHVICTIPYTVPMLTESTRAVGIRLEEQARVLGASGMQAFCSVTFPALLPACISALAMAYLISFSQYFLTLLIGGGTVKTFAVVMVPFLQGGDRTLAACYTALFLAVTLAVFGVFQVLTRKLILRNAPQAKKGAM